MLAMVKSQSHRRKGEIREEHGPEGGELIRDQQSHRQVEHAPDTTGGWQDPVGEHLVVG